MKPRRQSWYLLIGLGIGLLTGITYGWLSASKAPAAIEPHKLNPTAITQYRQLILSAFQSDQDSGRAQARWALLALKEPFPEPTATASVGSAISPFNLSETPLATAEESTQTAPVETATATPVELSHFLSETPVPSPSPSMTTAVQNTPIPTATQEIPLTLKQKEAVCDPALESGLLQVYALSRYNTPLAGVKLTIAWLDKKETFYTGLAPEISPGYADFQMTPEVSYSLRSGEKGVVLENIIPPKCPLANGGEFWGGWRVTFIQP